MTTVMAFCEKHEEESKIIIHKYEMYKIAFGKPTCPVCGRPMKVFAARKTRLHGGWVAERQIR